MTIQKDFGLKLKEFRLKAGLSQEKLAHKAEIDRTYITSIEKGERNVSLGVIEKLATALQFQSKTFLTDECIL